MANKLRLTSLPSWDFLGLVFAAGALLTIWIVISTLRQYLRLRHIPGPTIAGFSRWWHLRHEMGGNMNLDLYEVTKKYGSIARIGPDTLVTSDPDLIKRMYNVRTSYKRSDWYYAMRFNPARDNVLSMIDDVEHNKLRTKMAAGYSGKEIESLEPRIDRNIRSLIALIEKYIEADKPFDFARKAQFFTLDVISDLSYGEAFGFLANDRDMWSYLAQLEAQMPSIMLTSVYPWLVDVLSSPVFKGLVPSHKDALGFGKIMGIVRKTAAERFGPDKKVQNDMLGSFVAHGMTMEEAESEILMQIMAGSDTTATGIRMTLLHVISNPRVLARLRAELDEAGILSRPPERIISDAEAREELPYLQAIIKEGLRIHPPIAGLLLKKVPEGGDTFKGVYLPAGTDIGSCAWGLMRRREVFGEDAEEFRPERWLFVQDDGVDESRVEERRRKLREMEGTVELIFSYGRWQCLGKSIALMELNKVFVELLRRFDFVLLDPTKPVISRNVGIFTQSDMWMRGYKLEGPPKDA